MLQLQAKDIDICRISKLLVKHNIKASITDSVITLEGAISDELLTKLCGTINIDSVRNYIGEEQFNINEEETLFESEEEIQTYIEETEESVQDENTEYSVDSQETEQLEVLEEIENPQPIVTVTSKLPEYDLIYPEVKRGQAYWCDLECDDPECCEKHKIRPVIIISNDEINSNKNHRKITILPCSTKTRYYPYNYHFKFTDKIMIEKVDNKVDYSFTNADGHNIQTVDKRQLREYIGTMTPEFMEKMQDIIDSALSLKRNVKTIVKKENVYVDTHSSKKTKVRTETVAERKDVNMVQVQLLSFVDINKLNEISQSKATDKIKAEEMLGLFGFDFERNGVQYLLQAIIYSPKNAYFNLETLSEKVSKKVGIAKEEVMRLIVARVKERFGFKKAPTIDFIRLINSFLLKQEEEK